MRLRFRLLSLLAMLVVTISVNNVQAQSQSHDDGHSQMVAIGGGPVLTSPDGRTSTGGFLKFRYERRFKFNNTVDYNHHQLENTATVAIPLFRHGELLTMFRYGAEKFYGHSEINSYLGAGFQSPWGFKFRDRAGELEPYAFVTGRSFNEPGEAWLTGGGLEAYVPITDRLLLNGGVDYTRKNGLSPFLSIKRSQFKGFVGLLFVFGKK